jgi:hypothetical protein
MTVSRMFMKTWPAIYGELRKDLDLRDVTKVQKYGLTRYSGGSDIAF